MSHDWGMRINRNSKLSYDRKQIEEKNTTQKQTISNGFSTDSDPLVKVMSLFNLSEIFATDGQQI